MLMGNNNLLSSNYQIFTHSFHNSQYDADSKEYSLNEVPYLSQLVCSEYCNEWYRARVTQIDHEDKDGKVLGKNEF